MPRIRCNFDQFGHAAVQIVTEALHLVFQHGIVTPADWEKGDDVIIPPGLSTEDAQKKFPQGWNEVRPYLRFTKVA